MGPEDCSGLEEMQLDIGKRGWRQGWHQDSNEVDGGGAPQGGGITGGHRSVGQARRSVILYT